MTGNVVVEVGAASVVGEKVGVGVSVRIDAGVGEGVGLGDGDSTPVGGGDAVGVIVVGTSPPTSEKRMQARGMSNENANRRYRMSRIDRYYGKQMPSMRSQSFLFLSYLCK
jgi:hypothetical protein